MLIKQTQPVLPCIVPCLALLCSMCICPALPCPALLCPALPCPALPCPVLSHAVQAVAPCHAVLGHAERSMPCCAGLCWPVALAKAHPRNTRQARRHLGSHAVLRIKHAVHVVVCLATQLHCTICVWPLYVGERVAYFLGPVPQDKLPKDAAPGNCLAGSLKLGLLQGSKEHAPGAFPIFYRSLPFILSMSGCIYTFPSSTGPAFHLVNVWLHVQFASSCFRSCALSSSSHASSCCFFLLAGLSLPPSPCCIVTLMAKPFILCLAIC